MKEKYYQFHKKPVNVGNFLISEECASLELMEHSFAVSCVTRSGVSGSNGGEGRCPARLKEWEISKKKVLDHMVARMSA